jgi:HSP20 family molecular chaperone IbpA
MSQVQSATSSPEIQTREKQEAQRERTRSGVTFVPDVDIVERADEFVVTADMPGTDEKHVRIQLENGVLSIDADPGLEPDPRWTPLYQEYRSGGYHREFTLTDRVDGERIAATLRNGVLELHLPKLDRHRPRTIAVRAG